MSSKRTIVVTGASRGIGRAICMAFAGPDARIYFNYLSSAQAAEETRRQAADAGGEAVGIQADVSDESAVRKFFDDILKDAGKVDVLVNNAGIARDGLLVRMKDADWDAVMNTNLKGAFYCSKMAAKSMIKNRYGRIINISSIVGFQGNPGQANYVTAKAGLVGFTKAVARELASRNITVNAVAPGYIETDMTESIAEKAKQQMIENIPLGRIGAPEDVAAAVAFLASEAAGYITGQVIHVNGGMYM